MADSRDELVRVVRHVLGPLVRADGGRLYLIRADADSVDLHLGGRFSGCPGNTLVQRRVIEPALRAAVPNVRVTITAGAIVPAGAEAVEE